MLNEANGPRNLEPRQLYEEKKTLEMDAFHYNQEIQVGLKAENGCARSDSDNPPS